MSEPDAPRPPDDPDRPPPAALPAESERAVRLRAGDAERHQTAALLQDALGKGQLSLDEFEERTTSVWSTVYRDELEPLTADLVAPPASTPRPATSHAVATPGAPAAADRITGGEGPTFSMAIWSGFTRKGAWTVPAKFTGFAWMGGGELDLRYANFSQREVTITVVAIMGGIEIVVPDDAHVKVSGIGFMGAFEDSRKWDDGPQPTPPPDAPVITINGLALMAGIAVSRKPTR
ncbi:uncharacterized protein DUF1707 [Antricoccus suffuscus]|uniref:Uncharacterized protein DUF1707 n=1 Tax=Antricoccus suffuscus TaxID=1629062 RepID=A0A2T0ZWV5_9ACTN|nr:DUF1707 domain-containing protein [Antricoccus suffuscus]PRZ40845.1 uncharacterized protein DUF1707 [Antricoccus suffuscus]